MVMMSSFRLDPKELGLHDATLLAELRLATLRRRMARTDDLEQLYEGLTVFARRARELSAELHPGLSLVAFTILSYIEARPDTRAVDIAAEWGIEKSTMSRQISQLEAADLITRTGERPGRRGQHLELTVAGRTALDAAAASVREALFHQLHDWTDRDVATFARLMSRFNQLDP
jgi:DNA-binding MarR family transcriptional regulator